MDQEKQGQLISNLSGTISSECRRVILRSLNNNFYLGLEGLHDRNAGAVAE